MDPFGVKFLFHTRFFGVLPYRAESSKKGENFLFPIFVASAIYLNAGKNSRIFSIILSAKFDFIYMK